MSELSQLESGEAPFNSRPVNLHAILADAIEALPDLPGPRRHGRRSSPRCPPDPRRRGQAQRAFSVDPSRAPARARDERLTSSSERKRGTRRNAPTVSHRRSPNAPRGRAAAPWIDPLLAVSRSTSGAAATVSACRTRGGSSRRTAVVPGVSLCPTRRRSRSRRGQARHQRQRDRGAPHQQVDARLRAGTDCSRREHRTADTVGFHSVTSTRRLESRHASGPSTIADLVSQNARVFFELAERTCQARMRYAS